MNGLPAIRTGINTRQNQDDAPYGAQPKGTEDAQKRSAHEGKAQHDAAQKEHACSAPQPDSPSARAIPKDLR